MSKAAEFFRKTLENIIQHYHPDTSNESFNIKAPIYKIQIRDIMDIIEILSTKIQVDLISIIHVMDQFERRVIRFNENQLITKLHPLVETAFICLIFASKIVEDDAVYLEDFLRFLNPSLFRGVYIRACDLSQMEMMHFKMLEYSGTIKNSRMEQRLTELLRFVDPEYLPLLEQELKSYKNTGHLVNKAIFNLYKNRQWKWNQCPTALYHSKDDTHSILMNHHKKAYIQITKDLLSSVHGLEVDGLIKKGVSIFFMVCFQGLEEQVIELLKPEYQIRVNQCDPYGRNPLYAACEMGHTAVVKLLFNPDCKTELNQLCHSGGTPFFVACRMGYTAVVNLFLKAEYCAVINFIGNSGANAFYLACQLGQVEIIKALFASPHFDRRLVNATAITGHTPLLVACISPHTKDKPELFRLLLEYGANCKHRNDKLENAWELAQNCENLAAIKVLGPEQAGKRQVFFPDYSMKTDIRACKDVDLFKEDNQPVRVMSYPS